MKNKMTKTRRALTLALVITVGSFYSLLTTSVMAQSAPKLSGEISVSGLVTLNGVSAVSGATVLDGSRVKTGRGASAVVSLGRMGQVELGAESELVLKVEEGRVGGQLRAGRAVVSAPAGVGVSVETADGVASAEGKAATVLRVDVSCGNTRVAASRSDARVTAGNKVEYVAAGQEVAVGQASNQAGTASRCARLAAAAAKTGGAASLGATGLALLLIVGVAGAVGGIVAASQSDTVAPNPGGNISIFRP